VRKSLFPSRTNALAAPSVGLGMSATTVLRTSFFYNATSAASGVWTGHLKPGSCFDPAGDITSIQPQMFDQFALQYGRYKVNSAVIRIKIPGALGGASSYAWVAAAYPSVDPSALSTYQAAASQQYAKTVSGGYQQAGSVGTGTEGQRMTFKLKNDAIVGSNTDTWDSGALVTADPTNNQYAVLPIFLQASVANAVGFVLSIDIFQNVTFSQRKPVVDA